jgi:hypothetical protein
MARNLHKMDRQLRRLKSNLPVTLRHTSGEVLPDARHREIVFFEDVKNDLAKLVVRFGPNRYIFESGKEDATSLSSHLADVSNPHSVTLDQALTAGSVSNQAMDVRFLGLSLGSDPSGTAHLDISQETGVAGIEINSSAPSSGDDFLMLKNSGNEKVLSINDNYQFVKHDIGTDANNRPMEFLCEIDDPSPPSAIPGFRFAIASGSTVPTMMTWMSGGFAGVVAAQMALNGQLYKGTIAAGAPYLTGIAGSSFSSIVVYASSPPSPIDDTQPLFWVNTTDPNSHEINVRLQNGAGGPTTAWVPIIAA